MRRTKIERSAYNLGALLSRVYLAFLLGFNSAHLRIRKLHDQTYARGGTYKSWSDKKYSSAIHKATLVSFIVSFIFFQIFNYFNFYNPQTVLAGANTNTWTTKGDFESGSPDANVNLSGVNSGDNSDASLAYQMAWANNDLKKNVPNERKQHTAVWTGSKMIIWGGYPGLQNGGIYDPEENTWSTIATTNAPPGSYGHTAVWTGSKMITWGGLTNRNTGGVYDPQTNTWTTVTTTGAPTGRYGHTAVWTGSNMIIWGGFNGSSYLNTGGSYDPETNSWTSISLTDVPSARYNHTAIWTSETGNPLTANKMIVWGGYGGGGYGGDGGIYDPSLNTWTTVSTTDSPVARYNHTAVWTGSKMIIWGGNGGSYFNTGGVYDLEANTWSSTSTTSVPTARDRHRAVWTGSKMIIWGGYNGAGTFNTGGVFDPIINSWASTNLTNAPSSRFNHTAVWTGTKMIIWGGSPMSGGDLNTGGQYDLSGESWTTTLVPINLPLGRYGHTAIWTGSKMIVWGGSINGDYTNTGGIYDPVTDTWATTSTTNAPVKRQYHSAVWTGSKMIIWGGTAGTIDFKDTGGIYDPATDTWMATSITNAPVARRDASAVWTGSKMIIWGGYAGYSNYYNSGGIYDPATNTWTATSTTNVPTGRYLHTVIWTGSKMIVWGGNPNTNTGGIYDPDTDSWAATSTTSAPTARFSHTAVWTGSKMIIWGGTSNPPVLNTGGQYDPSTDSWTATSTTNAPVARAYHTAVWTGSKMIVWGGSSTGYLNTGGQYDASNNNWSATSTLSVQSRSQHKAVWTGSQMIVWGGYDDYSTYSNTGGIYAPTYSSPGLIPSFHLNAQSTATFSALSWNGTTPANTAIKFRTRSASTEGGLASATWSDYITVSGTTINSPPNQWLEIELTLESSDGANTPTLNDFTVTYDTLDTITNSNIILTKTDSTALKTSTGATVSGGVPDAWSNSTTLRVTTNSLACTDCATTPTNLRPEVEIKSTATTFDGTNTYTATAGNTYVDIPDLTPGTAYHLRVRSIDDQGRISAWTSYGNNAENVADFTIDQTAPAGTVSIEDGDAYATSTSVTLTLSATDTGGSNLQQMRFSNDGTTWSDWETYATTKAWTLTSGDGAKTVYGQFRDNANNTTGKVFTSQADWETATRTNVDTASYIGSVASSYAETITSTLSGVGASLGSVYNSTDNKLYFPSYYTATVSILDGTSGALLGTPAVGTYPAGIAYNVANNKIYVANNLSNSVSVIDGASNTVTSTIAVGTTPYEVAVNPTANKIYVTNYGANTVSVISGETNEVLSTFSVGTNPRSIGYNTSNNKLYIANQNSNNVTVVDSATDGVVGTITVGANPNGITVDSQNNKIFVSNSGAGTLSFINGETDTNYKTIIAPIKLKGFYNSSDNLLYGLNYTDNSLIVVDGVTDTVARTLSLGFNSPRAVTQHPTSKKLYISNFGAGTVSIVEKQYLSPATLGSTSIGLRYGDPSLTPKYKWSAIRWSGRNITSTYKVKVQVRPADTWGTGDTGYVNPVTGDSSWYEITLNSGNISILNSLADTKTLETRLELVGDGASTPILDDLAIESASLDTITLDTTPPSDISNLKAYSDFTKSSELTASTWYPISEPYFEWDANLDSDFDHYAYCFSTSASCTPATTAVTNSVTIDPAITFEGTHYFRVVAVDSAGQSSVTPTTFIYKFDATAPGAVTGLSASITELTKIAISWNAYGDGASPVENYKLERVKDTGNQHQIGDDWTTEDGYAVFTLTGTTFDDVLGSPAQGQESIEASTKYQYRIRVKDVSNPDYSIFNATKVYGMTNDLQDPTPVTNVLSSACDGTTDVIPDTTVSKCSDVANEGFEIAITWTPSTDSGTGIGGYNVYRSNTAAVDSYAKIATVSGSLTNFYYDNDTNNDANETTRLNDYTTYYYRITAFDTAVTPNETELIPVGTDNSTSSLNPDVTSPTAPLDVTASALGIDSSGERQKVQITWSASTDTKARSIGLGSGIKTSNGNIIGYKLYRSTNLGGPYTDVTNDAHVSCDQNNRVCYNEDLDEYPAIYYYRLTATDNYDNVSLDSDSASVQTASSAVPTTPTNVTVTTKTGNPNTDATVGDQNAISFTGSYSRNCANNLRCLVKYELWRSTTNHANSADWVDPAKSTKIQEFTPTVTGDDRGTTYNYTDTGLTDATTYYYKVRALDNTPADPDGGPFYSPLSTIATGTLHAGWDTTADATAPMLPLELKVKDIHDDGLNYKRNIITWKRIDTPTRNGANDFKEYRIYRSTDGLAWTQLLIEGQNPLYNADKEIGLATNYYMDLIPIAESNQYYYYYVTAVDDSADNYKYFDNSVINNQANESAPLRDSENNIVAVSLNPAIAKPSIVTLGTGKKATITTAGVSTATIFWTTDQPADSLVEFRQAETEDKFRAIGDRAMVIDHSIEIFDLSPNTTYEYRLISRNSLANDAIASGEDLPPLTTTGFNITPSSVITTTTTAEINWSTNLDASSAFVEYQLQRQVGDDPQSGTAGVSAESLASDARNHQVIIKGLRSNRAYTYKIKSISADGYLSEYPTGGGSNFETFRTKAYDTGQFTLAPSSSNVAERNITSTNAQIIWETAVPTTTWVDYGTETGIYDVSAGNNDLTTQHVVMIDGLTPGETYYYRVRVKDENEVEYTSQEYSFRAVLKPKISNLQISEVTPYTVTIKWETNIDTETLINWGKTTAYGEKKGTAGSSKNHEIKIENLEDNAEYHFQILARDEVGEEVAGDDNIIRTPLDTEGPKIEDVKIDILPLGESDEYAQVIISWKTNKPATTLVQYDIGLVGGEYSKSSIEDTSLTNAHTVIVKELEVASTYHYRIIAKDKRNNKTTSNDYTFVTPEKNKSIWQLIVRSLEETFSWVKNIGSFFSNLGKKAN